MKAIQELQRLQNEINEEIEKFDLLLFELKDALREEYARFRARICAGILDDFYMGVEKIFKEIADRVDMQMPQGDQWHKKLLSQMKEETNARPSVINEELYTKLEEYLKFRHMNRNVYGFYFEWDRMSNLVDRLEDVIYDLKKQLKLWFETMIVIMAKLDELSSKK